MPSIGGDAAGGGMSRLPVYVLAFFGLAFWWPSIRSTSFKYYLGFSDAGFLAMPVFIVFSILTAVLLAVVPPRFCSRTRRGWAVGAGVIGFATTVAGILAAQVNASFSFSAGALFAVYSVCMPLFWLAFITTHVDVGPRSILLMLAGSFALSYFPSQVAFFVPNFAMLNPVLGPLLSSACLVACIVAARSWSEDGDNVDVDGTLAKKNICLPALPSKGATLPLVPCVIIVCLVCSVIYGLLQMGSSDKLISDQFSFLNTIFLVLALALVVIAAVSKRILVTQLLFVLVSAVTFFVGNIVLTAAGQNSGVLSTSMLGPCRSLFCSLLFCLVAIRLVEARTTGIPREDGLAIGRAASLYNWVIIACNALWGLVVPTLVTAAGLEPPFDANVISLFFGLAMGVCIIVFLIYSIHMLLQGGALPIGQPSEGDVPGAVFRAGDYGLTERECETLELILAGHTYQRIADLQGITLSGIQARAKTIYRKLDVHSRQELVDMARSRSIKPENRS